VLTNDDLRSNLGEKPQALWSPTLVNFFPFLDDYALLLLSFLSCSIPGPRGRQSTVIITNSPPDMSNLHVSPCCPCTFAMRETLCCPPRSSPDHALLHRVVTPEFFECRFAIFKCERPRHGTLIVRCRRIFTSWPTRPRSLLRVGFAVIRATFPSHGEKIF